MAKGLSLVCPLLTVRLERPLDAPRLSSMDKIRAGDIGEASNDIVQLVKPRSDWWEEGPLSSPVRGVAATDAVDPLDQVCDDPPSSNQGVQPPFPKAAS